MPVKVINLQTQEAFNKNILMFVNTILGKKPFTLIVRAEHCQHCINMKGDWEKAKKTAAKSSNELIVVEFSWDIVAHLLDKHGSTFDKFFRDVGGVPHIENITKTNVRKEYNKPNRTHISLAKFFEEQYLDTSE